MKSRLFFVIGSFTFFVILLGCAGPGRVETDYGTSFKLQRFNQTLDMEAEKNLEPVEGFDGEAAKRTMERYEKGFETPPPQPSFTFGIGKANP